MKRMFAEIAAASLRFGDEQMVDGDDADWFKDDIIVDPNYDLEMAEMSDGIPVLCLQKELQEELIKPWKNALIIKFMGKVISFITFQQRVVRL